MDTTVQIFQIPKFPDTLSFVIIPRMFWRNLTKIDQIYILYKFAPSGWIRSKLIKVRKQHAPREEIISPSETANQWDNGTSRRQYLGCF